MTPEEVGAVSSQLRTDPYFNIRVRDYPTDTSATTSYGGDFLISGGSRGCREGPVVGTSEHLG